MKKTLEELETIITRNAADWAEGFFVFYTSDPRAYERLKKRVGEENFISCKTYTHRGAVWSWTVELPRSLYSLTTFGVRKGSGSVSEGVELEGEENE